MKRAKSAIVIILVIIIILGAMFVMEGGLSNRVKFGEDNDFKVILSSLNLTMNVVHKYYGKFEKPVISPSGGNVYKTKNGEVTITEINNKIVELKVQADLFRDNVDQRVAASYLFACTLGSDLTSITNSKKVDKVCNACFQHIADIIKEMIEEVNKTSSSHIIRMETIGNKDITYKYSIIDKIEKFEFIVVVN